MRPCPRARRGGGGRRCLNPANCSISTPAPRCWSWAPSPTPQPTATLSVSPESIQRGGSATLSWSTGNASSVNIDGIGAVSTTFIAGVEAVKRGFGEPIGSLTQLATVRLGKRSEGRSPRIKDFVPLASLDDLEFAGWDIFEDNAYEAARKAAVLERAIVDAADLVTAIAPGDAALYCARRSGRPVIELPPGYDGRRVAERRITADMPRRVVMVGSFEWVAKQINLRDFGDGRLGLALNAMLAQIAASVPGLNVPKLFADRNSATVKGIAKVVDAAAQTDNVQGTPTILVGKNGTTPKDVTVPGSAPTLAEVTSAIDAALGQ